jgi:hypothetical protein
MASKRASSLKIPEIKLPKAPDPFESGVDDGKVGQSYHERVGKGRKEFAFWLDGEFPGKIEALQKKLGLKYPKDVFEEALNQLYSKEIGG